MAKSSRLKITSLETAVQAFWLLQSQWNGKTNSKYTIADTNAILGDVRKHVYKSEALKQYAANFQGEVIYRPRRARKTKAHDVVLPLTLGK